MARDRPCQCRNPYSSDKVRQRSAWRCAKIVRMHGPRDGVIARVQNFLICKAAFEKALFVYPDAHLEIRQGARIIFKSKEEPRS